MFFFSLGWSDWVISITLSSILVIYSFVWSNPLLIAFNVFFISVTLFLNPDLFILILSISSLKFSPCSCLMSLSKLMMSNFMSNYLSLMSNFMTITLSSLSGWLLTFISLKSCSEILSCFFHLERVVVVSSFCLAGCHYCYALGKTATFVGVGGVSLCKWRSFLFSSALGLDCFMILYGCICHVIYSPYVTVVEGMSRPVSVPRGGIWFIAEFQAE